MPENRTLIASENSPYGRITRIAVKRLKLETSIEVQILPPAEAIAAARKLNPLGKLPILVDGKGGFLADSRTILDYFYTVSDPSPLLPAGSDRSNIATRQALALGILDAALLLLYETRFRTPEMRSEEWQNHQLLKIGDTISYFEANVDTGSSNAPDIGDLSLAVALEYLDFRFDNLWRKKHLTLVDWLRDLGAATEGFSDTTPHED